VRPRRRSEKIAPPVYRIILADDGQTRYHVDPSTGALVHVADAAGRWPGWLFGGLHRLDVVAFMPAGRSATSSCGWRCWAALA
jgi:hypothetical protein